MEIILDVNWDDEAQVWYAIAQGNVGLATESPSLDGLRERILGVLPDLFEVVDLKGIDVKIIVHGATGAPHSVAAE